MPTQILAPVQEPTQASPLAGQHIVITQAEQQSADFADLLRQRGAIPIFYPCIDIAPPRNLAALDGAIHHAAAGKFDWLVVTSTHSVESLAQRLAATGLTANALADLRVAALGPETAQAVTDQLGLTVETLSEEFLDTAPAQAMALQPGQRVLLAQSSQAKPDLANALRAAGADVTVVAAYRAVVAEGGEDVPTLLWRGKIDGVTFASGATIRYFRKRLDLMGGNLGMLQDVVVACIDPATAQVAGQYGLRVRVMPEVHTAEGLVEALVGYFGG